MKLYSGVNCSGTVIDSGPVATFASPGLAATVANNTTTDFRVTATDAAGNVSPCSDPITYVEDSTAPPKPTITATNPPSPANNNDPKIKGTAEAASTVKLYSGVNCSGTVIDSGPVATFASPGLAATVANNTTTDFRVTATDAAGNVSPCSDAFAYVEDSAAPATTAAVSTLGSTATASFSSEPGATFECRLDAGAFVACSNPTVYPGVADGDHSFEVRATDRSGNIESPPVRKEFTIATTQPPVIVVPPIITPPVDQTPVVPPVDDPPVVSPPDADPVDETPPITRIEQKPQRRVTKRMARFRFSSNEPGSRFRCLVDGRNKPCEARFSARMSRGRHTLEVTAIDTARNADPTPATHSWRVMKRSKRSRTGDGLRLVGSALAT